ncbi:Hypothetical_protein [Hexamita inflata]|uniref:Hypothetical_protein n=1 Tax=Hexamita inflata TaxID=28002 RepID=A0AA86ULB7_9EUKA|nr:Hypothetical protein HINF_LOCUS50355 [Hexamita inflata]
MNRTFYLSQRNAATNSRIKDYELEEEVHKHQMEQIEISAEQFRMCLNNVLSNQFSDYDIRCVTVCISQTENGEREQLFHVLTQLVQHTQNTTWLLLRLSARLTIVDMSLLSDILQQLQSVSDSEMFYNLLTVLKNAILDLMSEDALLDDHYINLKSCIPEMLPNLSPDCLFCVLSTFYNAQLISSKQLYNAMCEYVPNTPLDLSKYAELIKCDFQNNEYDPLTVDCFFSVVFEFILNAELIQRAFLEWFITLLIQSLTEAPFMCPIYLARGGGAFFQFLSVNDFDSVLTVELGCVVFKSYQEGTSTCNRQYLVDIESQNFACQKQINKEIKRGNVKALQLINCLEENGTVEDYSVEFIAQFIKIDVHSENMSEKMEEFETMVSYVENQLQMNIIDLERLQALHEFANSIIQQAEAADIHQSEIEDAATRMQLINDE